MRYRTRLAESRLKDMSAHFRVVLVTGARQVGKSTLLKKLFPDVKSFVFDPDQDLFGARADPDLFLDNFPPPLVLDEIQYAPELLPAIKRRVDLNDTPGQYLLSGSQNLMVLRRVSESLAGRVGILNLEGMTLAEELDRGARKPWIVSWLEAPTNPAIPDGDVQRPLNLPKTMWRGSMPGLLDFPDTLVPDFHRSYVGTYLERDVRSLAALRDLSDFSRFLSLTAALTAQEINDLQLGRELGVSSPTARAWRDILVHSYQWTELLPYQGNALKRLSGRRKGHFGDTGLACWLQRITGPDALAVNPLFGHLFESWVANEIRKGVAVMPTPPALYHWRTSAGAEVDLVLELDGRLYGIEVKAVTSLNGHSLRGLRAFRETYGEQVAACLVVYAGSQAYHPSRDVLAQPWFCLTG